MPTAALGAYVHFPYCRQRCPYCDFAVHVARDLPHVRYADAVLRELELRAPAFERFGPLRSIFFGGGTPSLWAPAQIERVRRALGDRLGVATPEITLEMNPEDLTPEALAALRAAGVERASIGVQSFDDAVLRALGRAHSAETAKRAVSAALTAGFRSVSVDLIFGGGGHEPRIARADAAQAAALGVHHVSAYALTLDELAVDVRLAKLVRAGRAQVADPDGQAELGEVMREALAEGGLARYEISNFAKPGHESRHNLGYWKGEPYLGLGVGAYGATPAERYGNPRGLNPYFEALDRGELPTRETDALSDDARLRERVFLGLRLVAGLDLAALARDFGPRALASLRASAGRLGDLVVLEAHRLTLTERGLDLHSEVCARLL